ncbi:MAG TPA: nitroreductase [Devosiaceae bacterium]
MPQNQPLLDYLKTRRSVTLPFLKDPGPSEAELQELLTIATRVPDHGKIAPWRLVLYRGDARQVIGTRLAEIAGRRNPGIEEAALEIERKQFLPAPLTVGVISAPIAHVKAPRWEQQLSAACVCLNLLNGAEALGYAGHWVTRWFAYDPEARAMLGAREGEAFAGFVHIGTPSARMEDRPRPNLADVVSEWRA